MYKHDKKEKEFIEKVIQIDRISRTVKGGRRIRFRALVVIGDQKGRVGFGIAKAQEVVTAISKAITKAKKEIINVPIVDGTILHEIKVKSGSAVIFLKPARAGTSIIAGGSVRSVLELSGIKNVVGKILGSSNKINNVKATFKALQSFIIVNNSKSKFIKNENSSNKKSVQEKK